MSLTKITYSMIEGPQFNATDYGVVGDGLADDTAALQSFFNAVTNSGGMGILPTGSFKISAPVKINISNHSFSIKGCGQGVSVLVPSSTFSGGTAALSLEGSASPTTWSIEQFSVQGTFGSTGTATIGFNIGDDSSATIGILGYAFSKISQVYVTGFATLWKIAHARMIHFQDCAGWGNTTTNQSCLTITQNGSFTGDLYFDKCQFVNSKNTNNYCVNIQSNSGPYNLSTGENSISGIKFNVCDFYAGQQAINVKVSNKSYISDIWFLAGCQIDQETTNAFKFESLDIDSVIENIHIDGCYINKSTGYSIGFSSTGTGGKIKTIYVTNNEILRAQVQAIDFYAFDADNLSNVHVKGNSIIDASTPGGAIEFAFCKNVSIVNNSAEQGFFVQKPDYLIKLNSGASNISCLGNFGTLNVNTSLINDNSGDVVKVINNNEGYNPTPNSPIVVGASPFTYKNTSGAPHYVYLQNGTISAISINGAFALAPTTNSCYVVPQGGTITVTYSVAPTMNYIGI